MNEMRLNHCRGVVTNLVDTQNRKDLRPEGTSHVNVNLCSCHDGYPAQRWHDLMLGSITEQGKLAESVRGNSISPRWGKENTDAFSKWRISS